MSKPKQTNGTWVSTLFPQVQGSYANRANGVYWTTQAWNDAAYAFFYRQLEGIAMNRFRWLGLPEKVDVRFLEYTLLYNGVATISYPRGLKPSNAFAMQAVLEGSYDGNMEYTKWRAQGVNGKGWECDTTNGVIVWDSVTRQPLMPQLQFIASECANIMRTKQTVRQHMRQPVMITAPREMSQQLHNLTAQIGSGEPYILAYDRFGSDVNVETLDVSSGREDMQLPALQGDLKDVWNMGLALLGVNVSERKAERQSVSEIQQGDEPTDLAALNALQARRTACEHLNKLTGGDAYVVWNKDVESATFNAANNLEVQMNAGGASGVKEDSYNNELD